MFLLSCLANLHWKLPNFRTALTQCKMLLMFPPYSRVWILSLVAMQLHSYLIQIN